MLAAAAIAAQTLRDPVWEPPIAHAALVLVFTRKAEALLYPRPFAQTSLANLGAHYKEAFTEPPLFDAHAPAFEWDHDPWTINVIGHGLLGSELYVRARACRFGWGGALAFTTAATITWEYLVEGNGTRPSAEDLVYTPLAGLVLGEARYFGWRAAQRIASPAGRAVLSALLDPFGELERATVFPC